MACLHASSFAAFIGKHPYEKHHEAFEKVWQRASPDTYHAALRRHKKTSKDEKLQFLRDSIPEVRHTLQTAHAIATTAGTSKHVCDMQSEVQREAQESLATLDPSDQKLVTEAIRKEMFTSYGTAKERSVLDILVEECHFEFDEHAPDVLYSKSFETAKGVGWKLVGKIDACTKDGVTLIEVKNRMHRLFMKPPDYERIQVECYLRLHGTATQCLLVESLRQDDSRTINIIPIERDDMVWEDCCKRADALINFLDLLVNDEALQDAYMTSKRPSAFIKSFLP